MFYNFSVRLTYYHPRIGFHEYSVLTIEFIHNSLYRWGLPGGSVADDEKLVPTLL